MKKININVGNDELAKMLIGKINKEKTDRADIANRIGFSVTTLNNAINGMGIKPFNKLALIEYVEDGLCENMNYYTKKDLNYSMKHKAASMLREYIEKSGKTSKDIASFFKVSFTRIDLLAKGDVQTVSAFRFIHRLVNNGFKIEEEEPNTTPNTESEFDSLIDRIKTTKNNISNYSEEKEELKERIKVIDEQISSQKLILQKLTDDLRDTI